MRAQLATRGHVRSQADMLIAATAQVHALTLVTRNVRDFDGCGIAVLNPFTTLEEVMQQANRLPYGLAAFAFTEQMRRANLLGDALESGMVGINTGLISTEVAPFGGVKQSGLGREGSHYGLDDYMELKYLCMGI